MKNSSDTIGIRARDLPACRAAPQPTVPPSAHVWNVKWRISSPKNLLDYILDSKAKMEAAGCSADLASLYKEGQRHNVERLKLQNNSVWAVFRFLDSR